MITVAHRSSDSPDSPSPPGAIAHPAATSPLLDERAAEELAATFAVLGDPTRVRLVDALAHGELCVSDLSAVVGLSESAVSHQLRLLRSLRIVRARRAGRQVYYQLDDAHIRTLLDQGRRHIEEDRP
jgi:ArsR family transcriptional regulator